MDQITFSQYFPVELREKMRDIPLGDAEEIRIRVGQPVELYMDGGYVRLPDTCIDRSMLREMLNYLTGYSLYALEEEMKQGFFTIEGGHRVGLCGHMSYHDGGGGNRADVLSDISGLNIRIAHEVKGCAMGLLPYIRQGDSIYNTLIFAPPGVGKTTYLRDLIRILSGGEDHRRGLKVGVVDERSEIAACHKGVAQNDLGPRTDVLDNCPKEIGMHMLLRSMSPEVIAVDELGKEADFLAVQSAMRAGVRIIGTIHAQARAELYEKPHMEEILHTGDWRLVRLIRADTEETKETGKERKNRIDRRQAMIYVPNQEEGIWVS